MYKIVFKRLTARKIQNSLVTSEEKYIRIHEKNNYWWKNICKEQQKLSDKHKSAENTINMCSSISSTSRRRLMMSKRQTHWEPNKKNLNGQNQNAKIIQRLLSFWLFYSLFELIFNDKWGSCLAERSFPRTLSS